jgi:predicted transcriptional regulator
MFTIDSFVDTVQTSKKQFVNTFVTNKAVADAMNQFIDQQSDYTKKAAKAGTDAVTIITNETVKAMQNATKFDYVKFGEGIMKAWTELQSKPVKSL